MPTEVPMPQMGESIFEGTITRWLKRTGDAVAKDEPLFEISTDKVDAEIPSPVAGVLTEIRFPEGATVEVNTVVALIGESAAADSPATTPQPPVQKAGAAQSPQPPVQGAAALQVPGRIRSSPLARRIAKEHGVDLSRIAGTGSGGRIGKDDVLRAAHSSVAQTSVQKSAAPQVPPVVALADLPADLVPLSRMRSIIAERMVQSMAVSPHVHTVYKIDMTRVVHHRDRHKTAFDRAHRIKLSFMPYIAVAAIAALQRYPIVNASLESTPQDSSPKNTPPPNGSAGLGIRYHQNIHLGIAVALDWGLIVPVVRQAEQRPFADLARGITDLALRARNKKLSPDEVGGSTFTLTNSGVFGDEFSTPIINQPESAILCISGLKKEPVVMLEFKRVLESWNQEIG